MTLDDAIRRERHAMRQSFGERSAEHRQLAEWLKELKQWKELVEGIDLRPASLMVPFQPNVNDLERENDRLNADNEKLMVLVRDMWTCVREGEWDCSDCPRHARCDDGISEFRDRMRQLGIEVGE